MNDLILTTPSKEHETQVMAFCEETQRNGEADYIINLANLKGHGQTSRLWPGTTVPWETAAMKIICTEHPWDPPRLPVPSI